jgi:hypothetical protein
MLLFHGRSGRNRWPNFKTTDSWIDEEGFQSWPRVAVCFDSHVSSLFDAPIGFGKRLQHEGNGIVRELVAFHVPSCILCEVPPSGTRLLFGLTSTDFAAVK